MPMPRITASLRCAGLALVGALAAGWAAPGSVAAEREAPAQRQAAPAASVGAGSLVGHGGPVKAVLVNQKGTRALTGSFDYSMVYWDLSGPEPKLLQRFDDHDGAVNAVRFMPDGKRALSAGDDAVMRLWDLETGTLLRAFKGHSAKIVDIAVSADGRLAASASWDRTARLWNLETGAAGPVLEGHTGPVNAVVFAAHKGKTADLFTASYDGTVRRWDAKTGAFRHPIHKHGWGINCLKALPDPGKLLFGALDGAAGIIDIEQAAVVTVLNPHEGPVLAVAVSPRHRLIATGGGDGTINIWSMQDWGLREQYHNPYSPIWGLDFAGDGDHLYYSGLDDFVTLWQISPREPFEAVPGRIPRRFQVRENMSLGEMQFARKCSVCHTITMDGGNRAGPTLFGLFGRRAGTVPGYAYSPALRNSDIVWTEETVGQLFDHGPQHVTPGSKMPLQRIQDAEKRKALIAYLKAASAGKKENPASDADARKSRE